MLAPAPGLGCLSGRPGGPRLRRLLRPSRPRWRLPGRQLHPGRGFVFSPFRSAGASWYGPGLYGNKTACGQTLRPDTLGVAHRNLPCGTAVKFVHNGHAVVTQVIDRGPFAKGRAWDLTAAVSEALEFDGVGKLRYAVAVSFARSGAQR